VAGYRVGVVALLADIEVDDPVAAELDPSARGTWCRAGVAGLYRAGRRAAVGRVRVAVVALLEPRDNPVAARVRRGPRARTAASVDVRTGEARFDRAGRRAAVCRHRV